MKLFTLWIIINIVIFSFFLTKPEGITEKFVAFVFAPMIVVYGLIEDCER